MYELLFRVNFTTQNIVRDECHFAQNLSRAHQHHCQRYQLIASYQHSIVSVMRNIVIANDIDVPTMDTTVIPVRDPMSIHLNRHRQDYIFFAKCLDIMEYVDNYAQLLLAERVQPPEIGIPSTSGQCGFSYPTHLCICSSFAWTLNLPSNF